MKMILYCVFTSWTPTYLSSVKWIVLDLKSFMFMVFLGCLTVSVISTKLGFALTVTGGFQPLWFFPWTSTNTFHSLKVSNSLIYTLIIVLRIVLLEVNICNKHHHWQWTWQMITSDWMIANYRLLMNFILWRSSFLLNVESLTKGEKNLHWQSFVY